MRTWLVTARDREGVFIDQREIRAPSPERAEGDAYAWFRAKDADLFKSTIEEIAWS